MPTIHFHQTTKLTPQQYIPGLTDFGPDRSKLFGNSADEYLKVHHWDRTQADVTEGSGGVWEAVLSTVEAEEGVAIVSVSARNLRANNVSFFRLHPDEVRVDLVATWKKKEPSVPLKMFLELLNEELPAIRQKTRFLER